MKRVLSVMPYAYLPWSSGGQKFVGQFFEYLGNETELTVVGVPENDTSIPHSYTSIALLKSGRSRYIDTSLIKKISAIIKEKSIDTVIWEHPYLAWLAFIIKKRTGVKTIIHTHNIEYQRFRSLGKWWWPLLRWYEKWAFRKADLLLFISPEDRNFATQKWRIPTAKTRLVPFGVTIEQFPEDRKESREKVNKLYNIDAADRLLFFNGVLDYKPNLDALYIILNTINPLLLKTNLQYKIIIAGRGLPAELNHLVGYTNIIYTGFVDDIALHFKAADIFLNPVQSGGGIKTKMVEAIAYGNTVVSTETGAIGIDREACGEKLIVVKDDDWKGFVECISHIKVVTNTPKLYYNKYNWNRIIGNLTDSTI